MIKRNTHRYSVSAMCKALGVARSTYYEHKAKAPKDEYALEHEITKIFVASRRAYGTRRIKRTLTRQGTVLSRRRIGVIMKRLGLVSTHCKPKYKRAKENHISTDCPNIVNRNFDGHRKAKILVSDLTYVRVGSKWAYVCLLLDLGTREVVGYSSGQRRDAYLVRQAFASYRGDLREVEIFHSDQGSEYINQPTDELLEAFMITRSTSRVSNPFDNAVAESLNKSFKKEFVYQEIFETMIDLQVKLAAWVWWYNNERLHSSLDYLTPREYAIQAL